MTALAQGMNPQLYVVTSVSTDGKAGCLAGFVTQCSLEPERFLVCISRANHTYEIARKADLLGLHLLGEDQGSLARLFGEETGDKVDKFVRIRWHPGTGGAPILEDCAAWAETRILEHFELGDHVGFLVEPSDAGEGSHPGILHLDEAALLHPGHPAGDPLRP